MKKRLWPANSQSRFSPGKNTRKFCNIVLWFFFFFLTGLNGFAQHLIQGTVTGSDSLSPVAGVSVTVRGTTVGTTTDRNGRYSISAGGEETLIFEHVGFATQTVYVNGREVINVVLRDTTAMLDEVVVIGYQAVRRKDLTGATVRY